MTNIPNYLLITTSSIFLVPAIYGYSKSIHSLSTMTVLTTICSINYWRCPNTQWALALDRTTAVVSCIAYFLYGVKNIKTQKIKIMSFISCSIIGSYAVSHGLSLRGSHKWLYAHVAFHFFTTTGKLLILHYSD